MGEMVVSQKQQPGGEYLLVTYPHGAQGARRALTFTLNYLLLWPFVLFFLE